ncbi:protein ORF39 [Anguillid herpesvirus 1]|uniref:Protein ORF39 n=1 Tax=Anguillid herpesvirus 1 TaxID=150286 RepID=A0A1J0REY3_9VIRU|nr:protein ORF39 [Anguillid herpesvirus 1]ADA57802.1 protein ORF39 [Anguillid herpesvirus 1]APD76202.1 ORF39 [Anguillid herpesvirus 1]QRM16332.1 protein ORF39 [Anguillid herpesvirus 1]QRM16462.1 protein ORF39 [Anguillid herpesvirus 1]QRM16591.1 protein ORF39 [Anguillid herpesvirus 1]
MKLQLEIPVRYGTTNKIVMWLTPSNFNPFGHNRSAGTYTLPCVEINVNESRTSALPLQVDHKTGAVIGDMTPLKQIEGDMRMQRVRAMMAQRAKKGAQLLELGARFGDKTPRDFEKRIFRIDVLGMPVTIFDDAVLSAEMTTTAGILTFVVASGNEYRTGNTLEPIDSVFVASDTFRSETGADRVSLKVVETAYAPAVIVKPELGLADAYTLYEADMTLFDAAVRAMKIPYSYLYWGIGDTCVLRHMVAVCGPTVWSNMELAPRTVLETIQKRASRYLKNRTTFYTFNSHKPNSNSPVARGMELVEVYNQMSTILQVLQLEDNHLNRIRLMTDPRFAEEDTNRPHRRWLPDTTPGDPTLTEPRYIAPRHSTAASTRINERAVSNLPLIGSMDMWLDSMFCVATALSDVDRIRFPRPTYIYTQTGPTLELGRPVGGPWFDDRIVLGAAPPDAPQQNGLVQPHIRVQFKHVDTPTAIMDYTLVDAHLIGHVAPTVSRRLEIGSTVRNMFYSMLHSLSGADRIKVARVSMDPDTETLFNPCAPLKRVPYDQTLAALRDNLD